MKAQKSYIYIEKRLHANEKCKYNFKITQCIQCNFLLFVSFPVGN